MTNKSERLKYLGVELLRDGATQSSPVESGLFRGIRERASTSDNKTTLSMILLGKKDRPNDVTLYNMATFNVLSLKMMYGDTKELIVFKKSKEDQEKALELLSAAAQEFQAEKRMVDNDPEIVNVETFLDVPDEFFAGQASASKSAVGPTNTASNYPRTSYGQGYNYNQGHNQNSDWQKKEEERKKEKERQEKLRWTPTLIKRKGDLPSIKAMNAIKKKIEMIANKTYSCEVPDPEKNKKGKLVFKKAEEKEDTQEESGDKKTTAA